MIVTDEQKKILLRAGKVGGTALQYGKKLIKVGESLLEVSDKVEAKIHELLKDEEEAGLAFPAQISRNATAAHNCPNDDDTTTFQEGDVVKIDVGVHIGGLMADNALTVDLSADGKYKDLLEASKQARDKAVLAAKPGTSISEVGAVIQEAIEGLGFKPVRNLSGHGLGMYEVHVPPNIPNYNSGQDAILEDGQLVAIEPFASAGAGMIKELGEAEIFMLVNKKPVRNAFTRAILKDVEKFKGLPFTTRWLTRKHAAAKVNYALMEMQRLDMIKCYPPLVDRADGLISQHEHTVIVGDKPIPTTKVD